ncbi:MAG: PH domain-containing protein [Methanobrevibacter sp.]|nr:PH domain-containing protein [Methanobrevibacter sp.]
MLFSNNNERANERVLYKTKPNMVLGCKKAIYGVVLLIIIFMVSPRMIQFIGKMQVYLISQIKLPLTQYVAIAFFVAILAVILYIIWQLISWYSMEYTLTDTRIIVKSGILSTKKTYMPYSTIQDVNSTQSIIARLFNIGTVSVFSAYDNNLMSLENISNPSEVEEIIFSNMMGYRSFQEPPRNFIDRNVARDYSNKITNDDYYDEYEPITPIGHERNSYSRREYEYYPENFDFEQQKNSQYEYEPYEDEFDYRMDRAMSDSNDNILYEGGMNTFSNNAHYNEVSDDYSYSDDETYQYDGERNHYNERSDKSHQNEQEQVDVSSETVIRRHFDKFKK